MIEVKNLTKLYGNKAVVDNLNFSIEDGHIYGFLGPNGAGKSTTMNMLTGYLAPSSGNVIFDGLDILKEPRKVKRQIGYLPEIPPLYPDLTVREYLDFAAELKGLKPKGADRAELEQIMERTGVMEVKSRLIKNLSKGYKQRVGISQALLGFPKLLILDEPTVGLDPKQIVEIRELILSLSDQHTVILSSHILQEISAVCDRIMIISKGRLLANDSKENLSENGKAFSMELRLKSSIGKARSALSQFSEISDLVIEEVNTPSEEGLKATFSLSSDKEMRGEIAKTLIGSGIELLEMRSSRPSLEDVYLSLTSSDIAIASSEDGEEGETANTEGTDESGKLKEAEDISGTENPGEIEAAPKAEDPKAPNGSEQDGAPKDSNKEGTN